MDIQCALCLQAVARQTSDYVDALLGLAGYISDVRRESEAVVHCDSKKLVLLDGFHSLQTSFEFWIPLQIIG